MFRHTARRGEALDWMDSSTPGPAEASSRGSRTLARGTPALPRTAAGPGGARSTEARSKCPRPSLPLSSSLRPTHAKEEQAMPRALERKSFARGCPGREAQARLRGEGLDLTRARTRGSLKRGGRCAANRLAPTTTRHTRPPATRRAHSGRSRQVLGVPIGSSPPTQVRLARTAPGPPGARPRARAAPQGQAPHRGGA